MKKRYRDFIIRSWEPGDRDAVITLIASVLAEYGLGCEPEGADMDAFKVEEFYQKTGGEFWAIERDGEIVATAAYYPVKRGKNAVEIRKMYLYPEVRGLGLGKFLLTELERTIHGRGFSEIWIETAGVLKEAVQLYERSGYRAATGVETWRCDRIYKKELVSP